MSGRGIATRNYPTYFNEDHEITFSKIEVFYQIL